MTLFPNLFRYLICVFLVAVCSQLVFAQDYPSKSISLVVGFGPGGNADIVARLISQKLSEQLGQSVVVDNKGGAGGLLASDFVAKSAADGYKLSLVSGAFPTQAAAMSKLPFDPINDFSWISTVISYPMVVVVNADSPFTNLNEFVKFAKDNPKKLNYPSPGNGSLFHLATEYFSSVAAIEMTHIPFKGGSPQLNELLAGRLDVMFDTLAVVQPHLNSGRLRAIAVTSEKRMTQLPSVPAVAEFFPGFEAGSFLGVAGPRGLSQEVITKLNLAIRNAVTKSDLKQKFFDLGGDVWVGNPKEMLDYIMRSTQKWKRVVQDKSIKLE
jgi:tripartite-type tricarboxylate transporter receptor subunit TctC